MAVHQLNEAVEDIGAMRGTHPTLHIQPIQMVVILHERCHDGIECLTAERMGVNHQPETFYDLLYQGILFSIHLHLVISHTAIEERRGTADRERQVVEQRHAFDLQVG